MGGLARRILEGQGDYAVGDDGAQRRDARGPGLIAKKVVDAFFHEPLLPSPDGRLADAVSSRLPFSSSEAREREPSRMAKFAWL